MSALLSRRPTDGATQRAARHTDMMLWPWAQHLLPILQLGLEFIYSSAMLYLLDLPVPFFLAHLP